MPERLALERVQAALHTRFVGRRIIYRERVRSTLDLARREAERRAPEGTVVIAEAQSAGRGRMGRRWVSQPGANLEMAIVLYPDIARLSLLSMITALAVVRAVEAITSLRPAIKWPNDALLDGKKFLGVLIETALAGDRARFALVGPGINVNGDFGGHPELRERATSLRAALGREVEREALLAAVLDELEALYLAPHGGEPVHRQWRARLETLGREVRVTLPFEKLVEEGKAEDVTATGGLVLRRADGSTVVIEAGDVTLRHGSA